MNKKLFSAILFFTITFFSFSQERFVPKPKYKQLFKTIPVITNDSPKWVHLLYSEAPNYFKINDAFQEYYRFYVFEKNTNTQNFKYFSKIIKNQEYLLEDGRIYIPEIEEIKVKKQKLLNIRSRNNNSSSPAANWTAIGPFETFEEGGVSTKSSQTNIYAFDQSISNPNVLFAGTETSSVFKSVDKGVNWFSVGDDFFNDGSVQSVEIDPTEEKIIYVGVGNKLCKSIDGGFNWVTLLEVSNLKISAITINSSNPQIMTESFCFKTTS